MFSGCMSTRRKYKTDKKQPGGAPNFRRRQLPHPNMHEAAKLRRMYILGFAATQ
jgi:hypothetical protein